MTYPNGVRRQSFSRPRLVLQTIRKALYVPFARFRGTDEETPLSSEDLRQICATVTVVGVVMLGGSAWMWHLDRPGIRIDSDNLFVIHAPFNGFVDQMNEGGDVHGGDLLMSFESTEVAQHIAECEEERKLLKLRRKSLAMKPLKLSPEMVRKHDLLASELQLIRDSLRTLASARSQFAEVSIPAEERLAQDGPHPPVHSDEAVIDDRFRRLTKIIAQIEHDRDTVEKQIEAIDFALLNDTTRAVEQRVSEMDEMQEKQHSLTAQIKRLKDSLKVNAPDDGKVLYCSRSPNVERSGSALMVFGPSSGFSMQARVPTRHLHRIKNETSHLVCFGETNQVRHANAVFIGSETLPHEPEMSIARFTSVLPHELAGQVADGVELNAVLEWRPPFFETRLIQVSLGVTVFGAMGLMLMQSVVILERRRSRRTAALPTNRNHTRTPSRGRLDSDAMTTFDAPHPQEEIHSRSTKPSRDRESVADSMAMMTEVGELADRFEAAIESGKVDQALVAEVDAMRIQYADDSGAANSVGEIENRLDAINDLLDGNDSRDSGEHMESLKALREIQTRPKIRFSESEV